jgi:hypothetical protein
MTLKCTRSSPQSSPQSASRSVAQSVSLSPAIRLHKAADAEVSKHRRHRQRNQKTKVRIMVLRSLTQRRAHPPGARSGGNSKNPEENPSQLQPQRPRQPDQPSANRLVELLATLLQPPPCLSNLSSRPRNLLRHPNPGSLSLPLAHRRSHTWTCSTRARIGALFRLRTRRRIRRRRRIHSHHQRLSRRTSPHTKRTTESNRIHTGKCSRSPSARESPPDSSPSESTPPAFIASNPSRRIDKSIGIKRTGGQRNEKYSLDGRRLLCGRSRISGVGL